MKREVNAQRVAEPDNAQIKFEATVNGQRFCSEAIRGDMLLIDYLHEVIGATGTHLSCGVGACSSCKVAARISPTHPWISLLACYARLSAINGMEIRTVESLNQGGSLHPLQKAFLDRHAFQCGFSTPGFLMAGFVLIEELKRNPIREEDLDKVVLRAINGHLCRCTGYIRYHQAICETIASLVTSGELCWRQQQRTQEQSRVSFAVQKRSGNDQQVEAVVGWFEQPMIESRINTECDLSTLDLAVTVEFANIRTGIGVRDYNLRKFLLSPFKVAQFRLGRASFVGFDQTLTIQPSFPGGVPVKLEGEIQLEAETRRPVRVNVSCLSILAVTHDSIHVTSAAPIVLDLLELELPVTEFALEFGIKLDAQVEITFDVLLKR